MLTDMPNSAMMLILLQHFKLKMQLLKALAVVFHLFQHNLTYYGKVN